MNRKLRFILLAGMMGFLLVGGMRLAYNLSTAELDPFLGGVLYILLAGLLLVVVAKLWRRVLRVATEDWFWAACLGWAMGAVCTGFSRSFSTFDLQLHDTYFVIAHFHLFAGLAVVFGAFALFYHYNHWMRRALGLIHFWITFLGSLAFIWPYRGLAGMPRRYIDYSNWVSIDSMGGYGTLIFGLILAGAAAQLVFVVNVVYSMVGGRKSVD